MELQFHKSEIPYLNTLVREIQNQELTQEVRLTDGAPDIGKVLASWGQLLVRGKEWRNGSVGVSGGVMVWVLYLPEEGQMPQSVATWLPFQMKWDIGDSLRDGTIHVDPIIRGVDARSVSARKLMVRVGIGVLAEASVPAETEIFEPIDLPKDVNVLKNTYLLSVPTEAGEKMFSLEENIQVPQANAQVEKIIRYAVDPEITESKVVSDKVVFRGTVGVHILYLDATGKLNTWHADIPFSQFAQLDKEYDSAATASINLVPTNMELEQGEDGQLNFKVGLVGQYVIYNAMAVTLPEDAYSNQRNITPQFGMLNIPARLDSHEQNVPVERSIQTDINQAVDVYFSADHPRLYREDGAMAGEISGMFQMLGYDENGELGSDTLHWDENFTIPADKDTRVDVTVRHMAKPYLTSMGDSATIGGEIQMDVAAAMNSGLKMMTGIEMGEMKDLDPQRPSLILRRMGEESLWELAKASGSTVEAIQKANNLQHEPHENQMLLIPVV